jgi:hypothetical protein
MRAPSLGKFYASWLNEFTAASGRQRHRLQLQATDEMIGRMIAKLKRIGEYDDSLTADR